MGYLSGPMWTPRSAPSNIRAVEIGDVKFFDVSKRLFLRVRPINADEDYALALILAPGRFEIRGLFAAGRTPRCPKVHDHDLTAQLAQCGNSAIKTCEGEIGRHSLFQWTGLRLFQIGR